MEIDRNNPVIEYCIAGTQAEFQGQIDQARSLYRKAWEVSHGDYEACIAAHYMARHQDDPIQKLYWNQIAIEKADAVNDERVQAFYPSLYVNMGQSFELLGNLREAKRYYDLAAELGLVHKIVPVE